MRDRRLVPVWLFLSLSVCSLGLVARASEGWPDALRGFLGSAPARAVGCLSYRLYVCHRSDEAHFD